MKKTTTLKVILLQAVVALPLLAVAQPAAEAPALERTPVALSLTLAPQVSPTVQPATLRETLLDARAVFAQSQPAIYQIRVIDEVTGEKSVIGSGFKVSADGLLATNYHVVSEAINKPDRYRVEYIDDQKNIGDLSVLDIDVIYDLAIARKTQATSATAFLPLGTDGHPKGERIYSMGNPHDLGMTIVEGTFNGLMERSPYEQMLISGSLNPGMSGGPTVDSRGQVVGVNVATAGNQISFLVPVSYLKNLINEFNERGAPPANWNRRIEDQLIENQTRLMDELLGADWQMNPLGQASVPGKMTSYMNCWGDSEAKNDEPTNVATIECSNQDRIFLTGELETGTLGFRHTYIDSNEKPRNVPLLMFTRAYSAAFQALSLRNGGKDDVEKFSCHTDFIEKEDGLWKAALCTRGYKDYPRLQDMSLVMGYLGAQDAKKGLVSRISAQGLTNAQVQALSERFMEAVTWQR